MSIDHCTALTLQQFTDRPNNDRWSLGSLELIILDIGFVNIKKNLFVIQNLNPIIYNKNK